ncbi:hypothetical protein MLD38_023639 [Melastoma candidum]|uniref:Uncharacterized protein n=1 Tax=Melastoma candidum TaxID=119954 RepID=A0ACB9NRE0_9MYRT|nr:hypothetical protein MLD38_023639 [Melastoma candidum]
MGKSSFFSAIFSIFNPCCCSSSSSTLGDYSYMPGDGGPVGRRIRPSDEVQGYWTAEPGIDHKASEFIARFYASRVTDPERQTLAV